MVSKTNKKITFSENNNFMPHIRVFQQKIQGNTNNCRLVIQKTIDRNTVYKEHSYTEDTSISEIRQPLLSLFKVQQNIQILQRLPHSLTASLYTLYIKIPLA